MTTHKLLQDLRHSSRSLRRTPSLTLISILTIALGVGAATTLFGIVKAVLLNPLPFGLYGVLSYTVTSSLTAIGIRMALGARPIEIFRLVSARAAGLTAIGAAIGLAGCVAIRGVLQNVVFGVGPSDPMVLSLAASLMFATAFAACWFPARRAMNVDPIEALREE